MKIFVDHNKNLLYIMVKAGDTMNENFGTVLKELRKKKKLTAKTVSKKLQDMGYSISDKTLSGYETGIRMPNADVFMALCQIYECKNILEIFSFVKAEYSVPTDDEWKIIEKYRFVSENSLDGINIIDTILNREYAIAKQLKQQAEYIAKLKGDNIYNAAPDTPEELERLCPPVDIRKNSKIS